MKLKGLHFADVAEIQEEGPKRGIFGSFSETTTMQKPVCMPMELIFNKKKKRGMCLQFLKKSVLKLLDRTVGGNLRC